MYNSGDAAEQIVRISLEGTEVALKLTGSAAKNIAAMIYAVLKNRDKNKTKGRQRLTAMLKSGKELKVFTVGEEHLKQFATEAKRYGVVYCALRGKEKSADGMVDIMVRAEDASKINRIVERFKLAAVDTVSIKRDIEKSKTEKSAAPSVPEQEKPDKEADDRLLDDLMGAPVKKGERTAANPEAEKTASFGTAAEKSHPSAPTSKKQSRTAEGTVKPPEERPSVREELREIKAKQQEAATKNEEPTVSQKPAKQQTTAHKQPSRKKSKKVNAPRAFAVGTILLFIIMFIIIIRLNAKVSSLSDRLTASEEYLAVENSRVYEYAAPDDVLLFEDNTYGEVWLSALENVPLNTHDYSKLVLGDDNRYTYSENGLTTSLHMSKDSCTCLDACCSLDFLSHLL